MNNANPPNIEILLDLKTEADFVRNRKAESTSHCDLKHMKYSEEKKPIIENVIQPDCITIDDDSDEDVTCLGIFSTSSSGQSKKSQQFNVTEESITTVKHEDVNLCVTVSECKDTCKSHDIITENKERSTVVENTSLIKVSVSSSPLHVEQKSSSNSYITPSKGTLQSDYPNQDPFNQRFLNCIGNFDTNSSEFTIPEPSPSPEISPPEKNTSGNIGPTVADSFTNLFPNIKKSVNDLSTLVSNTRPLEKNTSSRHEVENINVLQNRSTSSRQEVKNINVLQDKSTSFRHEIGNKNVPQESRSSIDKVGNINVPQDRSTSSSHEVGNINVPQERSTSSSSVFCNESSALQGFSRNSNVDCRAKDSTIINNNPNLKTGTQKKFGSEIKQQVRYVTLPAKFVSGKVTNGNNKRVFKVFRAVLPKGPQGLKGTLGNETPNSVGSMVQLSDICMNEPRTNLIRYDLAGIPIVTSRQSDFNPKKNISTKHNNNVEPPSMLLLNNQVIKLKGYKEQESQSRDTFAQSCDTQKGNQPPGSDNSITNQGCQTDDSSKSVVDQSTQTHIYSCLYKNPNLYTFVEVDGGGQQVELVRVAKTKRIAKPPLETKQITNPPLETKQISDLPLETNIGSPLSSLDDEFDTCLEDEISVIDPPEVPNHIINECNHSQNNVTWQTGHEESCGDVGKIGPIQPQIPLNKYQPMNTFQQVLYTDLGIYNPESKSITDQSVTQTNSYNNQTSFFQNSSTYQNGCSNTNTVYNTELQMFVPSSQKAGSQSEPAIAKPDVQNTTSNTNLVVEAFSKLLEDINTCLQDDALGNTPLHQAVLSNDLTKLKSQCIVLKTIGSNLNHFNLTHETALMLAVKVAVDINDFEAVSILISEGADQCIADQDGNTPLHYAVKHGCEPLVRVLLTAEDADKVTQKFNYEGFTPLHIAAIEGHDDIIKQLVGTNIDVNVKDRKNGRTAYFFATKEKRWATAQLLEIFGADTLEPNFSDQTPIFGADDGIAANSKSNIMHPADNRSSTKNQNGESFTLKSDALKQVHLKGVSSKESHYENCKMIHGYNKSDELEHEISINNQSVMYNKVVLSSSNIIAQKHILNSKDNKQKCEKEQNEPKTNFGVKEFPKSTGVALQGKETGMMQLKPVENAGIKKQPTIENNQIQGFTFEHSVLKHLSNDVQESSQSPSKVDESNTPFLYIDNLDTEKRKSVEVKQSVNPILYPSFAHSTKKNDQNITLSCGERSNKLLQNSQLPTKSQENIQLSSEVINFNSIKTHSVHKKQSLKPITHPSSIHPTKKNKSILLSSITKPHLGESSNVLQRKPHLPKESQEEEIQKSSDIINHNREKCEAAKQLENPISHSSKCHLNKNDQDIPPSSLHKVTLGETTNELSRSLNLSKERQERETQKLSDIINPISVMKKGEGEKQLEDPIIHSSKCQLTKSVQDIPSSSVSKVTSRKRTNKLLKSQNLSQKKQEREIQKSSGRINPNSVKKKSEEAKQLENPISHLSNNLTKNNKNSSSSQDSKIILEETCIEMPTRKQENVPSSNEVRNSNTNEKDSVGVKGVISHTSKSNLTTLLNTPIVALHKMASKERLHGAIRKSECNSEIKKDSTCISKFSKELPPLAYIQSEKQFLDTGLPDFETPNNKITYGSDDDCSEKNIFDLDLRNIEDVIIGNDSLLSNSIGPINEVSYKTTTLGSTYENKNVQISYDTLLKDVVKKKKEENISSKKTNTKHCSSRKRKKLDSGVLSTNTQYKKEHNSDRTKMLQQPISTALCPKTRLTSSPLKVGSSVELNVVNKELPNDVCSLGVQMKKSKREKKSPAFDSVSREKNTTNTSKTLHTNVEPEGSSFDSFENSESTSVSGSEGVKDIPENPKAKRVIWNSLSTDSKLNATTVDNSTGLVNSIQQRFGRIVAHRQCKSLSADLETNLPKQINGLSSLRDSKTWNTQSQEHRNTTRKRSLDLNEQKKTQTTEKKRVFITKIKEGNNTPEIISRRSTKIPKKKMNSNE